MPGRHGRFAETGNHRRWFYLLLYFGAVSASPPVFDSCQAVEKRRLSSPIRNEEARKRLGTY